jgi:hypothetical protein
MKSANVMSSPMARPTFVTVENPTTPTVFWSDVQILRSSRIWHDAYQSGIEMGKLQGEVKRAKHVHEHAENKERSLDSRPAVWTARVHIDGHGEEKRITP